MWASKTCLAFITPLLRSSTRKDQIPETAASFVAARGSTVRGLGAPPFGSGTSLTAVTSASGFVASPWRRSSGCWVDFRRAWGHA